MAPDIRELKQYPEEGEPVYKIGDTVEKQFRYAHGTGQTPRIRGIIKRIYLVRDMPFALILEDGDIKTLRAVYLG